MTILRLMMLGLTVAAAAFAPVAANAQPTYYVIRHFQKAEGQDPGLTETGSRNAQRLAELLADAPPSAIFASPTRRARETAQPAAERFGLTIQDYDPRDTPALAARVRDLPGPVLIVGHSNTVPGILEALEGQQIGEIPESEYGSLYILSGRGRPLQVRKVECPTAAEDSSAACRVGAQAR